MKRNIVKLIMMLALLSLFTSCSKTKDYEQFMRKTKEAIIEKKFEQAEGFIDLAVETKPKEQEAKNYQKQIQLYTEAFEYKEKQDFNNGIIKLDKVIKITNGSDKLVEYAEEEKKEFEALKAGVVETSDLESNQNSEALWNSDKKASLKTFMANFSNTMGQSYKEYNQSNSVDLYGVQLPSDIISGKWTMAINDLPIQFEWSETGVGENPYQLVAVYSDADTQPYLQKHVYFFMIENGTPKVYVTQQNQGNDQNYLYFSQTENPDLSNGFNNIVNNN